MRIFVAVASLSVLVFACSGNGKQEVEEPVKDPVQKADAGAVETKNDTPPPAAGLTAEQDAQVTRAVELFIELGQVVMSAKSDCGLMATKVNEWIDANNDERKKVMSSLAAIPDDARNNAYRAKIGEHVEVVKGMQAGIDGCMEHAGFVAAWKRLDDV